jgi:RNA polymerase sigma-70 factor (ECF subfamily)
VRVTFAHLKKVRADRARRASKPDLQLVPDGPVPADSYAARREAVWLLDQLPDEQRHALVLHHVLGMTVPEISEESKIPFETIRSRLRLGKQRLRALRGSDDSVQGGDNT